MVKWGSPFEGFEERIQYYIKNGEFELIKTKTRNPQQCVLCNQSIPPKSKPALRKYMNSKGYWETQYLCSYCFEHDTIKTESNQNIWM